ncbi:CaiB/BaiF CoA transferase family protein [[Actinomadura] parvosata]|uniref:CaiB/BaiF CoA transferase family protein n=1 Tax=[Actinomadura] parvosata TaxID=1955412 RepID=UPI00406D3209
MPLAALILADLGADVITVERPPPGDPARAFPAVFAALSRNQRSVSLDLRDPRGLDLFFRLAGTAHLVIVGQRPHVAARLGVHPDQVRARLPDTSVVSVSSFGLTGRDAPRPGHDLVFQALSGLLHEASPQPGAVPVVDIVTGLFTAIGALAALNGQARGGPAVTVGTAMLDCALALNAFALTAELTGLPADAIPRAPAGYDVFPLSDGTRLCLGVSYEAHHWRALCEALDLPELAAHTFGERVGRRGELNARLAHRLRSLAADEVRGRLAARGVPAAPVLSPAEVATRLRRPFLASPLGLDGQRLGAFGGVPRIGRDTAEVLGDLDVDGAELARLQAGGVVIL